MTFNLRALVHVGLENRQDNQAAVELREQAVARDPKFAPAYAALGANTGRRLFIVDPKGKQWEEKARARSVVQVHPGPPFKSPVNTRQFSLFPFPWIFLKNQFANYLPTLGLARGRNAARFTVSTCSWLRFAPDSSRRPRRDTVQPDWR